MHALSYASVLPMMVLTRLDARAMMACLHSVADASYGMFGSVGHRPS